MVGLDTRDRGDARLIRALAGTNGLHRLWVVVLDGEAPAIDMDALRTR
jgi:hypothetical protein